MRNISLSKLIPAIVTVTLIGSLVLLYFFHQEFQDFADKGWTVLTSGDEQRIKSWISSLSYWGPLIILAGFLVQMFAFVIPSWLLIVVSVLAYGPWRGGGLALGGVLLASAVAYAIGQYLSEYTVQKLIGKKSEEKMKTYLDRYGFWLIALFRLAPFLSNDTISFVAGLSTIRFRKFIAATALGITPLIGFVAYLGESTDRLKSGLIWSSAIGLIGFAVYVWWDQRQQHKQND